jgi:hypothetical protein
MALFFLDLLIVLYPTLENMSLESRLVQNTHAETDVSLSYLLEFRVGSIHLRIGRSMTLFVQEVTTDQASSFCYKMQVCATSGWRKDREKDKRTHFQSLHLSLCMGMHPRLGQKCAFQSLHADVLRKIVRFAVQDHRAYYNTAQFVPNLAPYWSRSKSLEF